MKPQLSQDYNVDNRYRGMEQAQDNTRAKQFLDQYIEIVTGKQYIDP